MNILDTIILHKKEEVKNAKSLIAVSELEKSPFFNRDCISISEALVRKGSSGIIAEHKRKSPSKGIINAQIDVSEVIGGYAKAGAAALSVLTDEKFFGGTREDLITARKQAPDLPILRKDFVVDEYQILEAKAWGADVLLLIASCLEPGQVAHLAKFASDLGLEVLLEVHSSEELESHFNEFLHLVGVNNRNLKTFEVDIQNSISLSQRIPRQVVKIAESGLNSSKEIHLLRSYGFDGFLIGEHFMKTPNPGASCAAFIQSIQSGQ